VRHVALLLLAMAASTGCTSYKLRTSIVNQAGTLTELQYQQVLGNLAMLSVDPDALPAHATLRDGSAQIQDYGALTASGAWGNSEGFRLATGSPSLSGSRTVVEQWSMAPITDKFELQILRIAYRRALGIDDHLEYDLANDLAHELCKQINQPDDIDIRSDPTLNAELLKAFLQNNKDKLTFMPAAVPADDKPGVFVEAPTVEESYIPGDIDKVLFKNYVNYRPVTRAIEALADGISYGRINANDYLLIFPSEWREASGATKPSLNPTAVLVRYKKYFREPKDWITEDEFIRYTATPVARDARSQVLHIDQDLEKIHGGWFGIGCKRDVPSDACYVGRYKDRYAWVCPPGRGQLADFTLNVLDFASTIKDQTILTIPGGPRFTPSTGSR
jgi:hypothetical protein